jgi:hypothetical protein
VVPLALLALCGCPSDPEPPPPDDAGTELPPCKYDYVGDPELPIELKPIVMAADETSSPLEDGTLVPLVFPPQGGRVIFIGARATNIFPCAVYIEGRARDVKTKQLRSDGRTINLKPGADGWAGSVDGDLNTFSNVPICPNQWVSYDAYDEVFELELELKDRGGKTASVVLEATLYCSEPDKEEGCKCICEHGYTTDKICDEPRVDAGVDGGRGGAGGSGS